MSKSFMARCYLTTAGLSLIGVFLDNDDSVLYFIVAGAFLVAYELRRNG